MNPLVFQYLSDQFLSSFSCGLNHILRMWINPSFQWKRPGRRKPSLQAPKCKPSLFSELILPFFVGGTVIAPSSENPPDWGWGCRIHWLHLCRRGNPPCLGYDIKQSDSEAAALEIWEMWSTSPLPGTVGWGCRICWLQFCWGVRLP